MSRMAQNRPPDSTATTMFSGLILLVVGFAEEPGDGLLRANWNGEILTMPSEENWYDCKAVPGSA